MSQLNCGNAERPVPNAIGRPRDRSLERRSGGRKSCPRPRSVAGLTLSAADLGGDDRRRWHAVAAGLIGPRLAFNSRCSIGDSWPSRPCQRLRPEPRLVMRPRMVRSPVLLRKESRNWSEVSNNDHDDIEKSRSRRDRHGRVDDRGPPGARTAGAVRRSIWVVDRLRQYRAFGRIAWTAEVPSDVSCRRFRNQTSADAAMCER